MRSRRRFNALAALGTGAHHAFERFAGVGVFLEPWLGRQATNVLWSTSIPIWVWRALRGGQREEAGLAFGAGAAIAGTVVHWVDWPKSLRFGVLPWLEEAEGLRPSLLPAYNTLLWLWFIGGIGSILFETRREHLKFVAAGLGTGPLLLASARHHFEWAREQARKGNPAFSPELLRER